MFDRCEQTEDRVARRELASSKPVPTNIPLDLCFSDSDLNESDTRDSRSGSKQEIPDATEKVSTTPIQPHVDSDGASSNSPLDSTTKRGLLRKVGAALKWSVGLYFKPKSFERNTELYKSLGVHHFKNAIRATIGRAFTLFWREFRQTGLKRSPYQPKVEFDNYHMDQSEKGLKRFIYSTGINELIHLTIGFGTSVPPLISNLAPGGSLDYALLAGFVTIANAYCIFLQRYNRSRIYNTLDKIEIRRSRNATSTNDD